MPLIVKHISLLSEVEEKTEVTVRGVVATLKEIRTQSGHRLGFANITDATGSIEVVLYEDKYPAVASLMKSEDKLLITGVLERIDSKMQIQVGDSGGVFKDFLE